MASTGHTSTIGAVLCRAYGTDGGGRKSDDVGRVQPGVVVAAIPPGDIATYPGSDGHTSGEIASTTETRVCKDVNAYSDLK
jgi:hypothetical protein